MSEKEQPEPKRKPKKISANSRDHWASILDDVEKDSVPVTLLESLHVNLIDGTTISVDIIGLLEDYGDEDDVQEYLNEKLDALDDLIDSVDFFVSLDELERLVQPLTDSFLKGL